MNISRHFLSIQFLVMSVVFTATSLSAENSVILHNFSRTGFIYNALKSEVKPLLNPERLYLPSDGDGWFLDRKGRLFHGFDGLSNPGSVLYNEYKLYAFNWKIKQLSLTDFYRSNLAANNLSYLNGFGTFLNYDSNKNKITSRILPPSTDTETKQENAGSPSTTINVPTNTANGDLLITIISTQITVSGTTSNITPPVGWIYISTAKEQTTSSTVETSAFYKIALSEPSTYTFTYTVPSGSKAIMTRISGFDASNPIGSVSSFTSVSVTQTTSLGGGITVTDTDGGLILTAIGLRAESGAPTSITAITTSNTTTQIENISGSGTGGDSGTPGLALWRQSHGNGETTGIFDVSWNNNANFAALRFTVNGGTSCTVMATCSPTVSVDWVAGNFNYLLTTSTVNMGSVVSCGSGGVVTYTLDGPDAYTIQSGNNIYIKCEGIGLSLTVTLTVSADDGLGNSSVSSCTTQVTLNDTVTPTIACSASAYQNISKRPSDLRAIAVNYYDNTFEFNSMTSYNWSGCANFSYSTNAPWGCANVGMTYPVTFTIADLTGHVTSCVVQITVSDTVSPTVQCTSTVTYDINGGSLSINDLTLSGSPTDNCLPIGGSTISKDSWTCADVGTVTYTTLTVTDTSGNVTSCTVQVTVTYINNVTVTYTGATLATTTNKSANVTLSATITLPAGANASQQAQVRFINRDTGQDLSGGWLALTGTSNTGTVSHTAALTLGTNEIFRKYNIGIEAGGANCFTRNSSADNVTVTVAEPSCGCY